MYLLLASPAVPVVAQELPFTPDPAACDVDAVEIRDLEALAAREIEAAPDISTELPEADADLAAEIQDVVIEATSCTNANQPLRAFTFFTDRFLIELFSDDSALLGHLDVATTRDPAVAPERERLTVEQIDNVRSDGTVAVATVTTSNRVTRYVDELTFQQIDGAWLIDAVRTVEQTGTNTATPEGE